MTDIPSLILTASRPAKARCRPAKQFDIINFQIRDPEPVQVEITKWPQSASDATIRIASVPIVTSVAAMEQGHGLGSMRDLLELLGQFRIPVWTLDPFLDDRISFIVVPHNSGTIYQLCFRMWSMVWFSDTSLKQTNAVLFWVAGSWAQSIAATVPTIIKGFQPFPIPSTFPGLLASAMNLRNVALSLADLDGRSFRTERRIREVIEIGALKHSEELARLSSDYNWIAARSIRERVRIANVHSFLDFCLDQRKEFRRHMKSEGERENILLPMQTVTKSLLAQASKLCEESAMHLATLYNLIMQRDSAANLEIAAGAREIAL